MSDPWAAKYGKWAGNGVAKPAVVARPATVKAGSSASLKKVSWAPAEQSASAPAPAITVTPGEASVSTASAAKDHSIPSLQVRAREESEPRRSALIAQAASFSRL